MLNLLSLLEKHLGANNSRDVPVLSQTKETHGAVMIGIDVAVGNDEAVVTSINQLRSEELSHPHHLVSIVLPILIHLSLDFADHVFVELAFWVNWVVFKLHQISCEN